MKCSLTHSLLPLTGGGSGQQCHRSPVSLHTDPSGPPRGLEGLGGSHPCLGTVSELALLQDLLHGLPERHLTVAAGQTLPGEELEPRHIVHRLALHSSYSEHPASSADGHLEQVGVCGRNAPLVVRVAASGAPWAVPAGTFPQMLQGDPLKAGPGLEVVGEEEKLPALL